MMDKKVSRSIAVLVSLAVILVFSIASATGVYAASKKTIYVPASQSRVYKFSADDVEKWSIKYTYDKKGLVKQSKSTNPHSYSDKVVFKRNSKGCVTSIKEYKGKKLVAVTKNTVKKGLVTKAKYYEFVNGKKKLVSVNTSSYYKNGNLKKTVFKSVGNEKYTNTSYYRKNGTLKKTVSKGETSQYTSTYNKKGLLVKDVYSYGEGVYKTTGTNTITYKLNKKGDVVKSVSTDVIQYADGSGDTRITTTTISLKYDKHGNKVKESGKSVNNENGYESTSSYTIKTKYKKVKVEKKYLKYAEF